MSDFTIISDEALQSLASGGDGAAEDELAKRYTRLVCICSRPFFLAGGDSEDLTQEGMLGLLSAIRSYNSDLDTTFKSYAELCIRRRIISAVKAASRMKHMPLNDGVPLDDVLSDETQTNAAFYAEAFRRTPEEQVLARESENELICNLSRELSSFEKKVVDLYLSGYSYREISQIIGRPVKSVDNAVQRIRRKLAGTA